MTIRTSSAITTAAVAAALLVPTTAQLGAAPIGSHPPAIGPIAADVLRGPSFVFKGRRFVAGSASAQAEAMRRHLNPNFTVPANALYVADPSLNAIVIYNAAGSGTQYPQAILSGPGSQINSPVAVSVGYDQPCNGNPSPSTCQRYLFVSNQNGGYITSYTLPLTAGNQTPYVQYESCAPGVQFPYGIVDLPPSASNPSGNLLVTNEGSNSIQAFTANGAGSCVAYTTNGNLQSPSSPSAVGDVSNASVYNANSTTITGFTYSNGVFGTSWLVWNVGNFRRGSASTQGTAASATEVFATTAQGHTHWPDAIWRCTFRRFPLRCPATPAYTNAQRLSFPAFPAQSQALPRLFVPNINNGTAIALRETNNALTLGATYINLVNPFGAAVDY